MLYPKVMGNTDGVPFRYRIAANDVNVVAALADAKQRRSELPQPPTRQPYNGYGGPPTGQFDFTDQLRLDQRIRLYESILPKNRHILAFDPTGDGTLAELHGTIDHHTKNLGVLVPGMTYSLQNYDAVAGRSDALMELNSAYGRNDLTMSTWLGGDLPDNVAQAARHSYAADLSPKLADFSHEVRREAGSSVRLTMIGHSYGGTVVGGSEADGLDADQIIHVSSAGSGHHLDTDQLDRLADDNDRRRYVMTPRHDVINGTRLSETYGDLPVTLTPHGIDPLPGADHLPVPPDAGHSGSFDDQNIAPLYKALVGRWNR